jgi:hypothetical protein
MKRRILPPIQVKQTSLNKFLPRLTPVNPRMDYVALYEKVDGHGITSLYSISIRENNVIDINEHRCKHCGKKLLNNGFNKRILELDLGVGRFVYHLHRKRCPSCGEIKIDLSSIVRAGSIYHDNYARRARQHYMNGLTPVQIRRAFITDFNVKISHSTIVRWINTAAHPLREMLEQTPVPSSGFWSYDEIHMRIRGGKCYDLCTIDTNTGFIPGNKISPELGRQPGKKFLTSAKRHRQLSIEMLVMDGTTVFGKLFHTRGFDTITLAQCLLHHKWQVCMKIKKLAGIPERSPKPIPSNYVPIKKQFYAVFDSPDETRTYIALEILRETVFQLGDKSLIRCFMDIEASLSKIIAWQRDPRIPKTNNKMENSHQHIEYYRSFKHRMMTMAGAQRVADFRVFDLNFSLFPAYIDKVWEKRCEWKGRLMEDGNDHDVRSALTYYYYEMEHLNQWYGEYSEFWEQYLMIRG